MFFKVITALDLIIDPNYLRHFLRLHFDWWHFYLLNEASGGKLSFFGGGVVDAL